MKTKAEAGSFKFKLQGVSQSDGGGTRGLVRGDWSWRMTMFVCKTVEAGG